MAERAGLRTGKKEATARGRAAARGRAGADPDTHVAVALRSAYEEAVREDVPAEFLDLLGKLA